SVPSDRIVVQASWSDGTFLYGFSRGAIYKVRIANGEIIPIAGAFDEFGLVDGAGSHARFLRPTALWCNGADRYVVDGGGIRHIDLATQQVDSFGGFRPQRIWGDAQYLYVTNNNYKWIYRVPIATHEFVRIAQGFTEIGPIWGDGTNLYF